MYEDFIYKKGFKHWFEELITLLKKWVKLLIELVHSRSSIYSFARMSQVITIFGICTALLRSINLIPKYFVHGSESHSFPQNQDMGILFNFFVQFLMGEARTTAYFVIGSHAGAKFMQRGYRLLVGTPLSFWLVNWILRSNKTKKWNLKKNYNLDYYSMSHLVYPTN